jgi:hypothetical protein
MANENATRSLDGTSVTITFTAEIAQHAAIVDAAGGNRG